MRMKRSLWSLPMLVIPRLVSASNLGPLVDFGPIGLAVIAIAYLLGGGAVVWLAVKALYAYKNREHDGMGAVMEYVALTVIGAVLLGTVVPGLIAPILAQGALPE
jgi:hypothetical protein